MNSLKALFPVLYLSLLLPLAAVSLSQSDSIAIDGITRIELSVQDAAGIGFNNLQIVTKLQSHEGDSLEVDLSGDVSSNYQGAIPQFELIRDGDSLSLSLKANRRFFFMLFRWGEVELSVGIPQSFAGELDIAVSSSTVIAEDLRLQSLHSRMSSGRGSFSRIEAETIDMKTSSGRTELNRIEAGEFSFRGSSGRIELEDLQADTAEIQVSSGRIEAEDFRVRLGWLRTSSGRISLQRGSGAISLKSSSGGINASWLEFTQSALVEASSGSVRLQLPRDASFELKARTSSGRIISDFPIQSINGNKGKGLEGIVSEGGPILEISTSSGSIRIESP